MERFCAGTMRTWRLLVFVVLLLLLSLTYRNAWGIGMFLGLFWRLLGVWAGAWTAGLCEGK